MQKLAKYQFPERIQRILERDVQESYSKNSEGSNSEFEKG
jgi:phosphatidate phosphatase APP1